MEMEKASAKSYTISTVNPDTGRDDDLVSTVRAAHVLLHGKAQDRGKARVGQFPLEKTLKTAGFTGMTAHFMLLLYELGIVAKVKREDTLKRGESPWEYLIAPFEYADAMLPQSRVNAALQELADRRARNQAADQLKKLQQEPVSKVVPESVVAGPTIEQLAEAVELALQAQTERDALQTEVAELQAQLAKASKVDTVALADELLSRVRPKK